jgi:site-specific recombinase XerD
VRPYDESRVTRAAFLARARGRGRVVVVNFDEARTRFGEYLKAERNASPNTRAAYARDLSALEAFLRERKGLSEEAPVPVALVDLYALRGHLGALARTHAPSSIARKIAAIRSFFRFLSDRGLVRHDPSEERPRRSSRPRPRATPTRPWPRVTERRWSSSMAPGCA